MDMHRFADPPNLYRPISFWSLNGELQDDELRRQIHGMKEAGWGGFFMHARSGMTTSYMTDEWLDKVAVCVESARAEGMQSWIYDEYQWPSGTCKNSVAGMDPAFRETHLFFAYDRIPHDPQDVTLCRHYRYAPAQGTAFRCYHKDDPMPPTEVFAVPDGEEGPTPDGMRDLYIYVWRAPLCNARFGGQSYVDLMNPDVARAFAAKTHRKYADRFLSDMGENKLIPGAFTDDLTVKWDLYGAKKNAVPWTEKLPELFCERFGYDILDHLPELFFDLSGAEAVRADYIRLVTCLFAENFVGELARICNPWGVGICGHLMANEGLYSDVMLQFYYEKYPTCDHLGAGTGDFRNLRRAGSVAEQFGKPATLCEAFAGGGHDMTFEDQRRQTDYLAHAGITTVVPHVTAYSMMGQRKYDHPPTFSAHAPFWQSNRYLADYQARLGWALHEGEQAADVLVLDPIESKYTLSAPGADPEYRRRERIARWQGETEKNLLEAHVEFAYGSEELMARFARVEDGRLVLGERRYTVLVLPFCHTLRATTLALACRLLDGGGRVVAVGRFPTLCDGRQSADCAALAQRAEIVSPSMLGRVLSDFSLRVETPEGDCATDIRSTLRRCDGGFTCFLYNTDPTDARPVRLRLPYPARVTAPDLYTGQVRPVAYRVAGGTTAVTADLAAGGSLLLSILPDEQAQSVYLPQEKPLFAAELTAPHALSLSAPNLLLLDTFSVEEEGKEAYMRYACDIKSRGVSRISAAFVISSPKGSGHYLLAECAENWSSVTLNGQPLSPTGQHPFDPCVAVYPLDGALREGTNEVCLVPVAGGNIEYQPVYIAGPFAVTQTGVPGAGILPVLEGGLPSRFCRDLTAEGLPFYCGCATLTEHLQGFSPRPGIRYSLMLCGLHAELALVRVNGKQARPAFDRASEVDITHCLCAGDNMLEMTLVGSLRNPLGPNRIAYTRGIWFNIQTFTSADDRTDTFTLIPFGLDHLYLVAYRTRPASPAAEPHTNAPANGKETRP